jgi:hypothetical protein
MSTSNLLKKLKRVNMSQRRKNLKDMKANALRLHMQLTYMTILIIDKLITRFITVSLITGEESMMLELLEHLHLIFHNKSQLKYQKIDSLLG